MLAKQGVEQHFSKQISVQILYFECTTKVLLQFSGALMIRMALLRNSLKAGDVIGQCRVGDHCLILFEVNLIAHLPTVIMMFTEP